MKIILKRYYGDEQVTKSTMLVYMGEAKMPALVCEARESAYRKYSEKFAGCSQFCLPEGVELTGRVRATLYSPMTVAVGRHPHNCKTLIVGESLHQHSIGKVLIGQGDACVPPEERMLTRQSETAVAFTKLVYEAYAMCESIALVADNSMLEE